MSIEKFNPSISGETIPYVQANTFVIQNIDNMEAGFVWIYLLTLPKDWTVVKSHIKNHFGIGDDRIKKIFAYLNRHGLIEYVRERDEKGKLCKSEIRILNGSRFKTPKKSTGVKTHPLDNHTCGKPPTTKNIDIQIKQKEQRIHSCTTVVVRPGFEKFWSLYPRKENKKGALQIWIKRGLEDKADEIAMHIMKRLESQWATKDKQYMPMPTTFLNGERWTDDLTSLSKTNVMPIKKPLSQHAKNLNYVMEQLRNGN